MEEDGLFEPQDVPIRMSRTQRAERDAMLITEPPLNPIFQKLAERNLSHGGGIGMIMRNQVLGAYDAIETHQNVLTTSDLRAKHEAEREAIIAIEKAKLAALKAEKVQKKTKPVIGGEVKEEGSVVPPPPERPAADAPGEPHQKKVKKKRRPVEQKAIVEEHEFEEEPEPERFVSLWEKYADEGPPEGDVGAEVAPPPPSYKPSGPKMFNVQIQVRPKDISKVVVGPDVDEIISSGHVYKVITTTVKPKMMDVSLMVRPRDREEPEPLFKNAYTQAHPRGYKELDLGSALPPQSEEKEVEAREIDIEKSMAASRDLVLKEGNVLWPSIFEFNSDLALIKIKTYIRNFWKIGSDWMFDVRFIQSHTTNYRKKFIYEVIFSKPTNEFPVPPATASVFFIFEAEHYNCPDQTMKVHFLLEGNRYPYKPGSVEFREEWLSGIIQDKLWVQKSINF